MKYIRLLVLMLLLVTSVAWAGTGTFKTYDGSSQTSTGTWDLSIPGPTVGTDDLEDHSITGVKIATDTDIEAVSVTLSDKVQAAWADIRGDVYASGSLEIVGDADIGGNLTGVNASFTGDIENYGASRSNVSSVGRSTGTSLVPPFIKTAVYRPTIANAASYTISIVDGATSLRSADLHLFDGSYVKFGRYWVYGGTAAGVEIGESGANFTGIEDNAGTWNVFSKDNNIIVQNNTGKAATMRIGVILLCE